MPGPSHRPTIGCPRWLVSASWWIQSGSAAPGTTRSIEERDDDQQRHDLAGQRGPEQPADRHPDAGQRQRVDPEHERADDRRGDVAAGDRRPDADPDHARSA